MMVKARLKFVYMPKADENSVYSLHSWAKFKIILVRKPGRKFYYFTTKFQGSGFSFPPLNQNIKVVIHYLKNKVGVVDFANAQGVVMF